MDSDCKVTNEYHNYYVKNRIECVMYFLLSETNCFVNLTGVNLWSAYAADLSSFQSVFALGNHYPGMFHYINF